ncbi:MAG: RimK family alpha-L-glutamate ligase [Pirellulales bacterium]
MVVLCSPGSWYFRDLKRAAEGRHEVVPAAFDRLSSTIEGGRVRIQCGEHDLAAADAVLVRTMPPGTLEQVVFRMDALARLEAIGVRVVNPARAVEAAVDKYLASTKLAAAGLAHPTTIACQGWEEAMVAFDRLGGDVVVKPLFGAEGRGIARVSDEAIALRVFKTIAQLGAVIYVQQFIEHEGADLRVLIIGRRALAMRRENATDWRTNVGRGATTSPVELTDELVELARRAADAIGAPVAGVDLLPARDGGLYVLEVNAVPGWQALARTLNADIARLVIDYCAGELM